MFNVLVRFLSHHTYDERRLEDSPNHGAPGEHEGEHADVERPGRREGREQRQILRETLAQLRGTDGQTRAKKTRYI